jgi:large subunit ribosomal protein L29
MKAAEIRKMDVAEIEKALTEARHELLNLRFQSITGQLTDTSRIRVIRREIARMETILRERALAEVVEESEA